MDLRNLGTRISIVASFGLLAACSGQTLDGADVEAQVLAELQASGAPVTSVTCPDPIEVESGATFTCTGDTGDGTWTIEVTQTDDEGSLSFEVVGTS